MIAQKDNALSMRDNAALKMISEDQKHIALAATRDSAAMRVISVITVVFLPGTFTAVSIRERPILSQIASFYPNRLLLLKYNY